MTASNEAPTTSSAVEIHHERQRSTRHAGRRRIAALTGVLLALGGTGIAQSATATAQTEPLPCYDLVFHSDCPRNSDGGAPDDAPLTFTPVANNGTVNLYHGVEHGQVQNVLRGIARPADGPAGNLVDDWEAFYGTEAPDHAAGYATDAEGQHGHAGGVVMVTLPRDLNIVRVNRPLDRPQDVQAIRQHFNLPAGTPMMDALAAQRIALWAPNGTQAANGTDNEEFIIPWAVMNGTQTTLIADFEGNEARGEDARAAWEQRPDVSRCQNPTLRAISKRDTDASSTAPDCPKGDVGGVKTSSGGWAADTPAGFQPAIWNYVTAAADFWKTHQGAARIPGRTQQLMPGSGWVTTGSVDPGWHQIQGSTDYIYFGGNYKDYDRTLQGQEQSRGVNGQDAMGGDDVYQEYDLNKFAGQHAKLGPDGNPQRGQARLLRNGKTGHVYYRDNGNNTYFAGTW